jgi:hypothetical protein
MLAESMRRRPDVWLAVALVTLWSVLHLAYAKVLILHDSWSHIFPFVYNVTKQAACGSLPNWLGMVDNGSPHIIYVISFSLVQIVRVPLLYLMSCTHPDLGVAMYLYKAQIYLTYLIFALSTYVLGRVLFTLRITATYLLGATLFAGLCLDSAHSNQVVSILFWVPWMLIAAVQYHRNAQHLEATRYLNAFILFFCLQILDQYPHFIVLAAGVAGGLYVYLEPGAPRLLLGRRLLRLWPGLLVVLVAAGQLLVVKFAIADYAPSLRSDLIVDPRSFGETGFVQPTALIGTFFPLAFMSGFETLTDAMGRLLGTMLGRPTAARLFIFRLDSLVFFVGMIPACLALIFAMQPGSNKLRTGWAAFTVILLLVSLQQSKLYLLLFHVPFFNVFRSYFLYIVFVAFAVLVMSAYGLDALLGATPEQRRAMFRRGAAVLLALTGLCAIGIGVLIGFSANPAALLRRLALPLVADIILIVVALVTVRFFCNARDVNRAAIGLLAALALFQSIHVVVSYTLLGTGADAALANAGLEAADRVAVSTPVADASGNPRKLCTRFAQCYLSQRHTVSLNTDLQGTFLRHRDEPVFQPGLARPVAEALAGLTHPAYWFSLTVVGYDSKAQLVASLNGAAATLGESLANATNVKSIDLDRLGIAGSASLANARIDRIEQRPDAIRIAYRTDQPAYLNAAINFDHHWRASVNGQAVATVPANFGSTALRVPAGSGVVELTYRNHASDYFFWSRYGLMLLSLVAVALLIRRAVNPSSSRV